MVRKELIFNSFYCWEGMVVLKELNLYQILYLECVVLLKELIFNSSLFWRTVVVLQRTEF